MPFVEIRDVDPEGSRQIVQELCSVLSKLDFVGGYAQIGNNLENQHIHLGKIKKVSIVDEHLVIEWESLVRAADPASLLKETVGDKTWVDSLYTDLEIKWVQTEYAETPYAIGLPCLETFDVRPKPEPENTERLTIRFFMMNETVILIPKDSPLVEDMPEIRRG